MNVEDQFNHQTKYNKEAFHVNKLTALRKAHSLECIMIFLVELS